MWWLLNWLTKGLRARTFQVGGEDAVVFVVGPSGSGKSSFTQAATKSDLVKVGRTLRPQTANVQAVRRGLTEEEKSALGFVVRGNIVFVDTPSFHTSQDDEVAEREMKNWLRKSNLLRSRCLLAGIIYMHRLETPPNNVSIQQHLNTFVSSFPQNFTSLPHQVHAVLSYEGVIPEYTIRTRREIFQAQLGSLRPSLGGRVRWTTFSHPDVFRLGDPETAWQAVMALLFHSRHNRNDQQDGADSINHHGAPEWMLSYLGSEHEHHALHVL